MHKKIVKKGIALLMAFVFVFTMAGCNKKQEEESEEDTTDMTYEGTKLALDGLEGEPKLCYVKSDKLYILTGEEKDGEERNPQFYTAAVDGKDINRMPTDLPEKETVAAFIAGEDGSLIYISISGESTENKEYTLVKIGVDGRELARENMTESLKLKADARIAGVAMDKDGNVIFLRDSRAYILDEAFQLIGEAALQDGHFIVDFARTKDGRILCVESDETQTRISLQVCELNVQEKKWEKPLALDLNSCPGNDFVMDGVDYDFYYKLDDGIYGYDLDEKAGEKILDYGASYLTAGDAVGILLAGENVFVDITEDFEGEDNNLCVVSYQKIDPAVRANRKTITYGTRFFINEKLKEAIAAFNRTHKDCQIVVKEYGNEEDSVIAVNKDIIAGDVLDMIDFSTYFPLSVNQCAAKGILEDLTPYFEKDSELAKEDIVPTVLEAMQTEGKLYYIASDFSVNTLVGKKKIFGDNFGWTYDELKELLKEKDIKLFYDEDTMLKSDLLYTLLYNGLDDFVDWETGECRFDGQDFKELLAICKERGTNKEIEESDAEMMERIDQIPSMAKEDKLLLERADYTSLESIQQKKQIFGEDVTYIGYPNEERQGSYFRFTNQIGICSTSDAKEAAWEFIRTFLTREYQGTIIPTSSTPIRQDCFELQIKAKMATQAYTDEFGQEIEPIGVIGEFGGVELEYKPLSQEEADAYVELVRHTKRVSSCDEEMIDIVCEEADEYFKGKCSLDKAADIIQTRITTYVNEQR